MKGKIEKGFFRILGYYPLTIGKFSFKCDPYNFDFWRSVKNGKWEPRTFNIFDEFLGKNSIYLDIGAWIGPTVIYAAKKTKQVYCIEPDYFAYKYLVWNIEMNKLRNVIPFNIALSSNSGIRQMASLGEKLGDSGTSFINADKNDSHIDVCTMAWSDWIDLTEIGKVDFIKIDIEGGEFELVPSMLEYLKLNKPIIHLSFHLPFLDQDKRQDALEGVINVMSMYKKCLNEKKEIVNIKDLSKRDDVINRFESFLFMD